MHSTVIIFPSAIAIHVPVSLAEAVTTCTCDVLFASWTLCAPGYMCLFYSVTYIFIYICAVCTFIHSFYTFT